MDRYVFVMGGVAVWEVFGGDGSVFSFVLLLFFSSSSWILTRMLMLQCIFFSLSLFLERTIGADADCGCAGVRVTCRGLALSRG